jgi:tRNA pseudouridine38-40 synthase
MRYKLVVAYLGTPFCGWQRQSGQRTVQGELERALAPLSGGQPPALVGAGRTDAGVHARGQVAHLDLPHDIPPAGVLKAVNGLLPAEIRVRSVARASADFHARRNARAKLYVYRARWRPPSLPWLGLRAATLPPLKDPEALERVLALLAGHHDMASFTVTDPTQGTTVRDLRRVWTVPRRHGLDLCFLGRGFLRYQVRRMVGAALEVGWQKRTEDEFRRLLDHPEAGQRIATAPAQGLTLERVSYRSLW